MNAKLTIFIILSSWASACRDDLRITVIGSKKPVCSETEGTCAIIERVSPLVAKPGSEVKVHGKNFNPYLKLTLEEAEIKVTLVDATLLTFTMPEGKSGFITLKPMDNASLLASNAKEIYRRADSGYPVITSDPALICSDIRFLNGEGELANGTKDCSPSSISGLENIKPENIKAGIIIGDVTGTLAQWH